MTPEEVHKRYVGRAVGYAGGPKYESLDAKLVYCTGFDFLAKVENTRIVEFSELLPYCFVEGEIVPEGSNVKIAVINKTDFANAWTIDKSFLDDSKDCYLEYCPAPVTPEMFRQFEFKVFKKGQDPVSTKPLLRALGEENEVNKDLL